MCECVYVCAVSEGGEGGEGGERGERGEGGWFHAISSFPC